VRPRARTRAPGGPPELLPDGPPRPRRSPPPDSSVAGRPAGLCRIRPSTTAHHSCADRITDGILGQEMWLTVSRLRLLRLTTIRRNLDRLAQCSTVRARRRGCGGAIVQRGLDPASTAPPAPTSPPAPRHPSEATGAPPFAGPDEPDRARRLAWAVLLRRTRGVGVLVCPNCSGPMRLVAAIEDPDVARRLLEHLGLPARAPPRGRPWRWPSRCRSSRSSSSASPTSACSPSTSRAEARATSPSTGRSRSARGAAGPP